MARPGYRPNLRFHGDVEAYFLKAFGAEHFRSICRALTCPSSYACVRVNTLETTSQEVLIKLHDLLKDFVTSFTEKPETLALQKDEAKTSAYCYEHPLLKNTIIVQGDGPHQVDYSADHALLKEVVVSRKCAEAVLRGANVFVPGVLACTAHVEQGDIVAVSVAVEHLDENSGWIVGVTRGTILFSEHGNAQFKDTERTHHYIGKGRAMLSRVGMFRELQGVAVEMVDRVYCLPPLHGILKGEIFLQNLPSIIAARVLDPQPGEHILDMCAAPGGKTTAMAILMKDKGTIIATDRSHNKVMDIRKLSEEMKITCVHAYKLDALKAVKADQSQSECQRSLMNSENLKSTLQSELFPVSKANDMLQASEEISTNCSASALTQDILGMKIERGQYPSNAKARKEARRLKNGPQKSGDDAKTNQVKGFLPHTFDKVLLDPPCSALGLRPRLFAGEETIEGLRRHAIYQKRLLDQAVQLCRPGGILVYSTCTINPGENEAVVRYALDTYSSLSLVPQNPYLGGPGLTGGLDDGVSYKQLLKEEEKHLVQRFDPSGSLDTIGFFIAKFEVKAS